MGHRNYFVGNNGNNAGYTVMYYNADRDTKDTLELGPVGGAMAMTLGSILLVASLMGTAWWFWTLARRHPRQPRTYPRLVNIGLLTILPTLGLVIITYYVTIRPEQQYKYGPDSLAELASSVVAIFLLLFAVLRGDCQASAKKLLPAVALALCMASGISMIELGRQARGKGYNDLVNTAILTDWVPVNDDTAMITLKYSTDKGMECESQVKMDCTMYWNDVKETYSDEGGAYDDRYAYRQNPDYWRFWEANSDTFIQSEFVYSNGDRTFSCRNGPSYQRRRLEEIQYYQQMAQQYDDYRYGQQYGQQYGDYEYGQEQAGNENQGGYFTVTNVLINSHACSASLFTEKTYQDEFIGQTPMSSMIVCLMASVLTALVFGSWSLCDGNDHEEPVATDGFVPAPDNSENEPANDGTKAVLV